MLHKLYKVFPFSQSQLLDPYLQLVLSPEKHANHGSEIFTYPWNIRSEYEVFPNMNASFFYIFILLIEKGTAA